MAPDWTLWAVPIATLLGLLVGSFLNVCIYRIPRDISVIAPRSFCPECGTQISWFDNIPIISYSWLRGKCRKCGQRIGFRYPLVEITTAALFAIVASRYTVTAVAGKWLLWEAVLVVLFWTDLEEQILPDELTLGGSVAGIALACFLPVHGLFVDTLFPGWKPLWRSFFDIALGIAVLAIPMWLLGIAYEKVRKREGLGFGDVKLLVLMSTFLGFENTLLATTIGAVGGSVIGVTYCLATRRKLSETHLPFGSFLCAGAGIVPLIYRLTKTAF
ncbi:MAG TPA: prepilin peptidase [Bryobacteraceae bacterium]|nr:prepilin peptidase [Bryobacteraceae bacterium]